MAVGGEGGDRADQVTGVVGVVEQPGLEVADHVGRAAGAGRDHRDAAGGRLAQRVAAGLVQPGVDQHVERGEHGGQLARRQGAGELRAGQPRLQPGPLRAVADHDRPDAGDVGQLREPSYVVAVAEAADVADDDQRLGPRAGQRPTVVQPLVAQRRRERRGVDAGLPQVCALVEHPRGGDQQPVGGHVRERRRLLDDQGRDAESSRVLERLASDGPGRGDVHEVGPEGGERVAHLTAGLVERPEPHDPAAAVGRQPGSGRDDLDLVAGVDEAVRHRLDGGRRAVHGREEGLGHEGDPHAPSVTSSRCPTGCVRVDVG